jgi:hypothetical protein
MSCPSADWNRKTKPRSRSEKDLLGNGIYGLFGGLAAVAFQRGVNGRFTTSFVSKASYRIRPHFSLEISRAKVLAKFPGPLHKELETIIDYGLVWNHFRAA